MRISMAGLLSVLLLAGSWGTRPAHAAVPNRVVGLHPHSTAVDPCGYRYAVWTTVQQTQDFAQNVDTSDSASTTRAYYLEFKLDYLAGDYNNPPGWNKLSDAQSNAIIAALRGDSLDEPISAMWAAVNSICSWKGKAATSPGVLNAYGNRLSDTKYFRVPNNWHVSYVFSCNDGPDSFMLVLYSASGQQIDITADRTRKSDNAAFRYKHGGTFYFKVISTCNWHVNVHA